MDKGNPHLFEIVRHLNFLPKESVIEMANRLSVKVSGRAKSDYINAIVSQKEPADIYPKYYE